MPNQNFTILKSSFICFALIFAGCSKMISITGGSNLQKFLPPVVTECSGMTGVSLNPAKCDPTITNGFGGGDGKTAATAYLICSLSQFESVAGQGNAANYYQLNVNIDFKGNTIAQFSSGPNGIWAPTLDTLNVGSSLPSPSGTSGGSGTSGAGTSGSSGSGSGSGSSGSTVGIGLNQAFAGNFEGNGCTLANFVISQPDVDYAGLFGVVAGNATIQNLNLVSPQVTGRSYVGALVGEMQNTSTVTNCTVTGGTVTVSGYNGGGLVGGIFNTAKVTGSKSSAKVSAISTSATVGSLGGLVGVVNADDYTITSLSQVATSISGSSASGEVSSPCGPAGGLVGWASATSVDNSSSSGTVSGGNYSGSASCQGYNAFGGLVGAIDGAVGSTCTNCSTSSNIVVTNTGAVPMLGNFTALISVASGTCTLNPAFSASNATGSCTVNGAPYKTTNTDSPTGCYQ